MTFEWGPRHAAADVTRLPFADVTRQDTGTKVTIGALQAPLVKTAGLLQALPRNFAYGPQTRRRALPIPRQKRDRYPLRRDSDGDFQEQALRLDEGR